MVNSVNKVGWKPYDLDYHAQDLVLNFRNEEDVLNESHKMRMTVAYGLERFWGEHLRLKREKSNKEAYWLAVWERLHSILSGVIDLPNDRVGSNLKDPKQRKEEETKQIQGMAKRIWSMSLDDQRIALMVLTQLCDALVWWTQRYKVPSKLSKEK